MTYTLEARVVLEMEQTQGEKTSRHLETKINVDVSSNLDRKQYLDKDDLPTAQGSKVLTGVLIQGLVANIHQAHQNGYRDSAEHLRYIISELERGFVAVANVDQSTF